MTWLYRDWREISLAVLLVNFHVVTGRIFDRQISRPLKWHNQPGKKSTSFPGFSPTRPAELRRAGRREPWERGWKKKDFTKF